MRIQHANTLTHPRQRWILAACALAVMGVLTTGCTAPGIVPDSTSVEPHEAWSAEIAEAKAQVTSKLEVEIFADDDISQSEYESAVAAYVECAKDRGVTVTLTQLESSLYEYRYEVNGNDEDGNFNSDLADERLAEADAIMLECSTGTTGLIEAIYSGMVQDPTNAGNNAISIGPDANQS